MVLSLFEQEFVIFSWMDHFGLVNGILIRFGLFITGLVMIMRRAPKSRIPNFPELKEIQKYQQEKLDKQLNEESV